MHLATLCALCDTLHESSAEPLRCGCGVPLTGDTPRVVVTVDAEGASFEVAVTARGHWPDGDAERAVADVRALLDVGT